MGSLLQRKVNRSIAGNIVTFIILIILGCFTAFPLIYVVSNAFKPLNELFIYPPKFFPSHPTFSNFKDIFILMRQSWVPFSRYLFNTLLITVLGTLGHLIIASLAAYPLAKHRFPGRSMIFNTVVMALMFSPAVTGIAVYIIMSKLNLIDSYLAVLLPAFQSSLGLYLMKQFMETIPDSILESARIDGASEVRIYRQIVMPMVKPAWLTLIILMIQQLWGAVSPFTYSEELKPLPLALMQILAGGIVRTGAGSAVAFLMLLVPLIAFILSQSQVIETMSTSGLKE